jgi:hypothetical protein
MIPPQSWVVTHPGVLASRLGEEMVLVHLETNQIYELNRTAARLWELAGAGCRRDALERQLLSEFAVGEAELAQEVDALLTALVAARLITIDDVPAT